MQNQIMRGRASSRSLPLALFFSIVGLASCGKGSESSNPQRAGIDPSPQSAAPTKASDSFKVGKNSDQVLISAQSLEKEFLLQTTLTEQTVIAMGDSLKSRIVIFKKKGSRLYMQQAPSGHTVSRDFPQDFLLAEFPILSEEVGWITFDFNAGMSQVFILNDWYTQDLDGSDYSPKENFEAVPSRISYLESARMTPDNQLVIDQTAQLVMPRRYYTREEPVRVHYTLSPYHPDPEFQPSQTHSGDRFGYFEVSPQLTLQGATVIRAAKIPLKKPLVMVISANTPLPYRQAIREGLLYWNRAFGREVIQAVEASGDEAMLSPEQNGIQWVNWDQAEFAYADAQMDPRSGEVLWARIYLPSGFSFFGRAEGMGLMRSHAASKSSEKLISLQGISSARLCSLNVLSTGASPLGDVLTESATEEKLSLISQDYLRSIVAHEMGHILGLRHNFAGSTASQVPLSEQRAVVDRLIATAKISPEQAVASTVMDYLTLEGHFMLGAWIRNTRQALEYDRKAIENLYLGKRFKDEEIPAFCTDSDVIWDRYSDCTPFDSGRSPAEFAQWSFQEGLKKVPDLLFHAFLESKAPAHGEETVRIDKTRLARPKDLAEELLWGRELFLRTLTDQGGVISVQKKYAQVNAASHEEVRNEELDFLRGEVDRFGGLNQVLAMIPGDFIKKSKERFDELLSKHSKGKTAWGIAYEFSQDEMEAMRALALSHFRRLEHELHARDLAIFNGDPDTLAKGSLLEHPLTQDYDRFLLSRMKQYLESADPEEPPLHFLFDPSSAKKTKEKKIQVGLPSFLYSYDLRVQAGRLLRKERGESVTWGQLSKLAMIRDFEQWSESFFKAKLEEIDLKSLPQEAANWVIQGLKILDSFDDRDKSGDEEEKGGKSEIPRESLSRRRVRGF